MIQFNMHNKALSWVLECLGEWWPECWYTHVWVMMTTNQKGFEKFFPSWNETPWYRKTWLFWVWWT